MGWKRAVRAAVALGLCGCVGPTIRDPHAGQRRLTFHNEAGGPVCRLSIYPFGQSQPSNNFLEADTEIPSGGSVDYWVTPSTYQVHAEGCPYEKTQVGGYAPQVIMEKADAVTVLFREDDAKSKDAAQAIVHAHQNGTMIPAKLTVVGKPAARPTTVRPARTNARS
ncbi:MAG TPA: hypothetical protein VMZ53_25455 [Kofleriaceae bacterium]|nr:hypothetical protein [Kofleriaceae bacterium]